MTMLNVRSPILARIKTTVVALIVAVSVFGPTSTRAQVINFAHGFASHTGLTANGSAFFTGTVARLTDGGYGQAGSLFYHKKKVSVTQFTNRFTFQLFKGTNPPADGITFTIQNNSPTALGPAGGGLGYGPDHKEGSGGIPNSVALKFDLYNNEGEGINSTGLYFNGEAPTTPWADLDGTGINLHSQHRFLVRMEYDGVALGVTIRDNATRRAATLFYTVDIPEIIGSDTAYVGFTGGTGGLTATQDIRTWKFASTAGTSSPQAVPEPGGLALLGSLSVAGGLLCWLRRRHA